MITFCSSLIHFYDILALTYGLKVSFLSRKMFALSGRENLYDQPSYYGYLHCYCLKTLNSNHLKLFTQFHRWSHDICFDQLPSYDYCWWQLLVFHQISNLYPLPFHGCPCESLVGDTQHFLHHYAIQVFTWISSFRHEWT